MARNIALLNKVMDFIEEHPERHNQTGIWSNAVIETVHGGPLARLFGRQTVTRECGSTGCFAGWTVYFADGDVRGSRVTLVRAREMLGLTWYEGDWLFAGDRTRTELRQFVDRVTNEEAARVEALRQARAEWIAAAAKVTAAARAQETVSDEVVLEVEAPERVPV